MPTIREDLSVDHEAHVRMLTNLLESIDRNDSPEQLGRAWAPFEEDLLEHLDAEERSLFCVFDQTHHVEILALRAEHRSIRLAVIELSVSVALHTVRRSALESLLALIRDHISHEDRTLHVWLDEDEGVSSHRGVLAMRSRRPRAAATAREAQVPAK